MIPSWAETLIVKRRHFFVEREVAKIYRDQLRAKLLRPESKSLLLNPTDNPEAYDAYLPDWLTH